MINTLRRTAALCAVAIVVTSCGGGGGDSTPPASTATFPLYAAYKANIIAGQARNLSVSGTCGGTGTISQAPAVATTFEGVNGYSATSTLTLNLTGCTPATSASTSVSYYDSSYAPLGSVSVGSEYRKVTGAVNAIPATVKVGDTAIIATFNNYTDNTKTTLVGTDVVSFVIEADTATTAIANAITRNYDTANNLLYTQQSRYRIGTSGGFSLVSVDVQRSFTSTTHLLLTAI